ncbi:MAG: lmo0937 family membrane protein [Solirubrobacteraceae bacterium]
MNSAGGSILYLIAIVLLIAWAIGYIGYNTGVIIHILLVIAVIAVLLKIIRGKSI